MVGASACSLWLPPQTEVGTTNELQFFEWPHAAELRRCVFLSSAPPKMHVFIVTVAIYIARSTWQLCNGSFVL